MNVRNNVVEKERRDVEADDPKPAVERESLLDFIACPFKGRRGLEAATDDQPEKLPVRKVASGKLPSEEVAVVLPKKTFEALRLAIGVAEKPVAVSFKI